MTAWSKTAEVPERGSAYAWFVIGLWMACSLGGFIIVFNIGLLIPSITDEFSLSSSQQGILGSIAFWGTLALAIPIGWWTSKFGSKIVVGSTLFLAAGLLLLQALSPVFLALLTGRLLFGICLFALEPPGAVLIQQWFPRNQVVFVNSVNNLGFGIVMGLGSALTPFVLELAGGEWRIVFYIFAGLFLLFTFMWMAFSRERTSSREEQAADKNEAVPGKNIVAGALKHKDMWVAGFGMVGASIGWTAFLTFFPTLATDTHDISLRWSGFILAIGLVAGGVSGVVAGYVLKERNLRREVLIVLGISMAGGYVAMSQLGSPALLMMAAFFAGAGSGYFPVLYSVPFALPAGHPKQVGVGVAFILTSVSLGTLLGPLLTGFLEELFDRLDIALFITGLAPLSLVICGLLLSPLKLGPKSQAATA